MRVRTDDGVGLEVEVNGAGPGLVLLHGLGGAKEDFADHVPELARDHTVVVFDHRGHGASDNPTARDAYSPARLAADTLQVADAVGLDHFRLLGHSMGGMVARKAVLQEPARIDALVMMDTWPGPIPGWDPALLEIGSEVALTQGKAKLKELLDMVAPLDTPAYRRVLAERPGFQEFVDRKFADLSEIMWGTLILAIAYQSDDLAAMAATVTCPLLVLVGDQDEPLVTTSRAIADAIPHAQLVVIPDAGHSPQFENPGAWLDAMRSFLASVPTVV